MGGKEGEERTVSIVPVLRKHHWYGADHGAHTDTLHTGPDRASYATGADRRNAGGEAEAQGLLTLRRSVVNISDSNRAQPQLAGGRA